jgi:hypothetical protein
MKICGQHHAPAASLLTKQIPGIFWIKNCAHLSGGFGMTATGKLLLLPQIEFCFSKS